LLADRADSQHGTQRQPYEEDRSYHQADEGYRRHGTFSERCQPAEGGDEDAEDDGDKVTGIPKDVIPKVVEHEKKEILREFV
jgi:hypothetical protein